MIAAKEDSLKLTPEEYFIWEEQQLEKHEYIDGEVYAMSGGSKNHSLISVRIITLLSNHLEGSGYDTGCPSILTKGSDVGLVLHLHANYW